LQAELNVNIIYWIFKIPPMFSMYSLSGGKKTKNLD
jgi:hypothetical protein